MMLNGSGKSVYPCLVPNLEGKHSLFHHYILRCAQLLQSRKNIGVGYHALLQGIVPTQGLNQSLLHCRLAG